MDDYERQIQNGKQIVTDYIQKERPDYAQKITELKWESSPEDKDAGRCRLAIYIENHRETISFLSKNLADAPGTPDGSLSLKLKEIVDDFFRIL